MRIVQPGYEYLHYIDSKLTMKLLERAARTCYKSEDRITDTSADELVARLIKTKHDAMIEHGGSISIKLICDRGVSHEAVRHRLASFAQSSTRYCNYSKNKFDNQISVIMPCFWKKTSIKYGIWLCSMKFLEFQYMSLIKHGTKAQEARSVLPNSLMTEIVITTNLREWRHIFNLRCSSAAHPQIAQIMLPLLEDMYNKLPIIFEDLYNKYKDRIEQFKVEAPAIDYTDSSNL